MKLLLLILLLVPLIAGLAPLHNFGLPNTIPDQYLVVLQTNSSVEIRDFHVRDLKNKFAVRASGEKIIDVWHIGTFIGFGAIFGKDILQEQLQHPNVLWIEADQIVTLNDVAPDDDIIEQTGATWGIDRIDQRNLPLNGIFAHWATAGTGTVSYVVDTGLYLQHNELAGRSSYGYNAISGETDADCNGHGTHVAGTIGGTIYGVAKKTTFVGVKVLNCGGSGAWTGVVSGVQWVTNDRRARGNPPGIANLSLGGGATPTADAAVAQSIADGTHFSIAAGNSNADACNYSPARVPTAVTVGATTNADARASFSNVGPCVDIFAPGNAVTSAWIGSPSANSTISGTSMAAPHVAGTLALHAGHLLPNQLTPAESHTWVTRVATSGIVTTPGNTVNLFLHSPTTDI